MFNFVGKYLVGTKLLKKAIEEVLMEDQFLQQSISYDISGEDSVAWREGDKWYGFTYSHEAKRYFFDDMGDESLVALWERQWEWEDKQCQN